MGTDPNEIIRGCDTAEGFEVLLRRWVIEHTLAGWVAGAGWPMVSKQLSKLRRIYLRRKHPSYLSEFRKTLRQLLPF